MWKRDCVRMAELRKQPRNVMETKTENVPITSQLCVSDLNVSQCQHISDPKHIRQMCLTPSFCCPWLNERKRQIMAREVYNEEAISVVQLSPSRLKHYEERNAAQLRGREGKERGRHWGSNTMKDGILFGSEGREGRDTVDMGDSEWTLPPRWITNHLGKHNA